MEQKFPMVSLIHDARAFLGLSIEEVQRILGPAAKPEPGDNAVRLRSRAGKRANLLVFAEQGIACSSLNEGLDFLEVFPPRTQREYEARIYLDPGPFIR